MSRLKELHNFGQSPWYDNISRGILISGKLGEMIREDGIAGVTTNPAIFEKSINGTADYDQEIEKLSQAGKSVSDIYDTLTTEDVLLAAELLKETYTASRGVDGYVSLEVSPHLAHDRAQTVTEAQRLFARLGRQNVMIKVPATIEGAGAIRELIAAGINVNATLIFSLQQYQAVVQAYLNGLTERINRGLPVDKIASVASFFVSRIDSCIDKIIDARPQLKDLRGQAAVALCKVVYDEYRQIFSSQNWQWLAERGTRAQRLLFGSTSTKDPSYPDVKYVDEIIGAGTVNTLPEVSLSAFRDHGKPAATLGQGLKEAKVTLLRLEENGIFLEDICRQIQADGVKAFIDSYDKLIHSLKTKVRHG